MSSLDNLISGAGDAFGLIGLHALTADYVHHHQDHDNIYSDMRQQLSESRFVGILMG